MKLMAMILTSLLAISAQASVLEIQPSGKKLENVALAKSATLTLDNQNIALELVGSGLRTKKVLIATVKVYVAQLLSSDASRFVRNEAGALASLEASRTTVMALSFLRTVDAATVQQSFKDALKANQIDLADKAVASFLKSVANGGDAKEGKTLVIALQKNADGTETVSYEDTNSKLNVAIGEKGLTSKILAIWLGTPADNDIAKLKTQLISGK